MVRHLHRAWSRAVDEVSFGAINLLHLRHAADARGLGAYVKRWEGATFADYYRVEPPAERRALDSLAGTPPDAGRPSRIRFPTPLPGPREANNQAVFDLYPGPKGWTAPTLLIAHGLMSVSDIGYRQWAAKLNRRGWNGVFVHLPYHYARRPAGTFSGELSVTPDLVRTIEGVRQSVMEMRILLTWLQEHGGGRFAVWGTSYGAWISALLGCVEERVERLILVEPILDIDAAIWHSPACAAMRKALRREGIDEAHTEPHLRLCCPLQVPTPSWLDPRQVLMLAGTLDRIAAPATIRALHEKWVGSHYYEFPQGHVGYRLLPESARLAAELWPGDFASFTPGEAARKSVAPR